MNGYLKIREVAEKWEISERRIDASCLGGGLEEAIKFGNTWAIFDDLENQMMRELNQENM